MQKIKIGLVGFDMSTQVFHLPFWCTDMRSEVVCAFEHSGNKAQAVLPQAQVVCSFGELSADDVNLVIITTPNQTHFDFAVQTLCAGKNAAVEEPLRITATQALELAELVERQGVLLIVYQNRRWDNALLAVKKLLSDDLLGEVVDVEFRLGCYAAILNKKHWKEMGETGVGLVYGLGPYPMDMVADVPGMPDESYAGVYYQHEGTASDGSFHIALCYTDGKKVALTTSKYTHEPLPFMTLHGKHDSYVKQNVGNQEALLLGDVQPVGVWSREPEGEWGILHTEIDGVVIHKKIESVSGSYTASYRNLYDALQGRSPAIVQPRQAAEMLWLPEKVYESAKLGCRVRVQGD